MSALSRAELIRLYKTLHTWTGIVSGFILFIAFLAGALTMFKEPLNRWITPPPASITPLDKTPELIERTLAARPDAAKEFTLELGEGEEEGAGLAARLTWRQSREDEAPWSAELTSEGELKITRLHPSALAQIIDFLHRTGGLPLDLEAGTAITGVVAMLYALALISGVVVLLPSLVKDFLALRLGANLKRMWLDAHNLVGMVSLPFHLVIALSSVVFGLHDVIYDSLEAAVYGGRQAEIMRSSSPLNAVRPDPRPAAMLPPQVLAAAVTALEPNFRPTSLQYRRAGTQGAVVRVWGHDDRFLVRGRGMAVVGAVGGKVVDTEYLPGRQGRWSALTSSFFALHFGSFGGWSVRWSYVLLGLGGAFLFYSGNLLWIESRRRRERHGGGAQSRSTRLMAEATIGVCLGCACGLAALTATAPWLNGHVADVNSWHRGVYYAVFLGSVLWAFGRGAPRAAVDLSRLAAAGCLAVPLTSLTAMTFPALGVWTGASAVDWGVEGVALVFAGGFALTASAVRRRGLSGPRDSVWASRPVPSGQS